MTNESKRMTSTDNKFNKWPKTYFLLNLKKDMLNNYKKRFSKQMICIITMLKI